MSTINFKIRFSTGETVEVTNIEIESTIGEVKKTLFERNLSSGAEPDRQRLIFKGRILGNEQTLTSAGVQEGNTLHLVKSSSSSTTGPKPPSTATPTSSFPGFGVPQQQQQGAGRPDPYASFLGGGGGGGGGGMGGGLFPGMGGMPNPELMRQMMESPMVQRMLENPETLRAMVQSNPMMRAMIEQNPQLEHVLNDPEIMRQAMQAATNPALMQEMLRSQDRALANIESLPGGHNALRRMYEQDIDPMVRAAEETTERLFDQQRQQQQQQQNSPSVPANNGPSNTPIPNPWGAQTTQQQQPRQTTTPSTGNANPWAGGFGGFPPPPGLGAGLPSNFASMLQDPEYQRKLMDPANMQAIMQITQGMQQLQRSGLIPADAVPSSMFGMPGSGLGGLPGLFPGFPNPTTPTPPNTATTTPSAPAPPAQAVIAPEIRYANQLSQLESMGFLDRERNIRALVSTNGDVQAAIGMLLG